MRDKGYLKWLCLFLIILFLLPVSGLAAKEKTLIGEEALYFSLPSTQDQLITYLNEYYGKYYLVMTFFPAAFTPV